jgi:hypothetical protein
MRGHACSLPQLLCYVECVLPQLLLLRQLRLL